MTEAIHEPFHTLARQRSASEFGIWTFIASELVFFGVLFVTYALYRYTYWDAFNAAGVETDIRFGTANTAILLTTSATMTVAIWASEDGHKRTVLIGLALTALLGLAFMAVKGVEYYQDINKSLYPGAPDFPVQQQGAQMFFGLYWTMTAVHAVHLSIGIGAVAVTFWRVRRDRFDWRQTTFMRVLGLYWHLIDLIWIVLYPLLYLVGRSL